MRIAHGPAGDQECPSPACASRPSQEEGCVNTFPPRLDSSQLGLRCSLCCLWFCCPGRTWTCPRWSSSATSSGSCSLSSSSPGRLPHQHLLHGLPGGLLLLPALRGYLLLKPIKSILRYWDHWIAYNVFVITMKNILSVSGSCHVTHLRSQRRATTHSVVTESPQPLLLS